MPRRLMRHYARLYGARTHILVGDAGDLSGLGRHFGGDLYEAEVRYLIAHEWAMTADDVLVRRTKHGLHLSAAEKSALAEWFDNRADIAA